MNQGGDATRRRRVAAAVAVLTAAGSIASPIAAHADSSATTFYVDNAASAACSDSTSDSSATPYCTIQAAVNAATSPGDTVIVAQGSYAPFTVTASGTAAAPITVEGAVTSLRSLNAIVDSPQGGTVAAATISGASYVVVKGLKLYSYGNAPAISITGADDVTVDSDYAVQEAKSSLADVAVSSGSYVSITRDYVGGEGTAGGVLLAGGSNDTVASDYVQMAGYGPGLMLDGSTGAAVAGDSVLEACGIGIGSVDGSSSSSIENNVVDRIVSTGTCVLPATGAGALSVDSASVPGTTADYNVLYTGENAIPDYSWAGIAYTTTGTFEAATGQGAHDLDSAIVSGPNSVTIDSANADAPGETTTDVLGEPRLDDPSVPDTGAGTVTYYDRGAEEYGDPITASASTWPTKAPVGTVATFSKTWTDPWSSSVTGCTFTFSDTGESVQVAAVNDTCSTTHSFAAIGNYTIELAVSLSDGYISSSSSSVSVDAAAPFVPAISLSTNAPRTVLVDTGLTTDDWNIVSCTIDYGDGTVSTVLAYDGEQCGGNHTYATPGTYEVTVTQTDSGGNQASSSESFTTTGTYFTPIAPVRVLDTRDGTGAGAGQVGPDGTVRLKIAGVNGVPTGVTAVSLNVTVTDPSEAGFITVYPSGQPLPDTSNVNFGPGQTRANTVVAEVGTDGYVDLTSTSAGGVQLVADLEGYYSATDASGYISTTPTRVLDTRVAKAAIPAGGTVKVNLGSYADITAATVNVTVTDPTAAGFISAYPDGTPMPNTSSVNYGPGQTIANGAVVEVGKNGYVDFTNTSKGSTDLVVDLTGYFTAGSGASFVPIAPTRFLDTRNGIGVMQNGVQAFGPGYTGNLYISATCPTETCVGGGPVGIATAMVANITVTEPTSNGFISIYPNDETSAPNTSVVNFAPGQTTSNATTVGVGADPDGGVFLYNASKGTTQLVVDVFGYYA